MQDIAAVHCSVNIYHHFCVIVLLHVVTAGKEASVRRRLAIVELQGLGYAAGERIGNVKQLSLGHQHPILFLEGEPTKALIVESADESSISGLSKA